MLIALTAALLVLAAALLATAHVQADKLVRPVRRVPPKSPAGAGLARWEEVCFATHDGLTLRGWFVPPGPEAGGATVVCAHGTGGHRGHLLPQAALLQRAGYGVLLPDLRNHGHSDGHVSSQALREADDLRAALAWLRTRPEVDSGRLALLGHSMGATSAIRAAGQADVQAVVAIAPFASLTQNVVNGVRARRLPVWPLAPLILWLADRRAGARLREVRPLADVARLGRLPLLLIHGQQDQLVHPDNSRQLYAARPAGTTLLELPGAGHRDMLSAAHLAAYQELLLAFLAVHLAPDGWPVSWPAQVGVTGWRPGAPWPYPPPEAVPNRS